MGRRGGRDKGSIGQFLKGFDFLAGWGQTVGESWQLWTILFGELKLTIVYALGFGSVETSCARKICLRGWAEWTFPAGDRDGERW